MAASKGKETLVIVRGKRRLEVKRSALWIGLALAVLGLLMLPASGLHAQGAEACTVTASISVNRRAGPGTYFTVLNTLAPGNPAPVHGQVLSADNFTWWQLEDGSWVRSDVVQTQGACDAVPRVLADGTPGEQGRQAFAQGLALVQQGDYEGALTPLELARVRFHEAGMLDREVLVLLPLSSVYQDLGDTARARATLEDALSLWRALDNADEEAFVLFALGDVYRAQGDYAQAQGVYQQAFDIQEARGNRSGQAVVLHAMGLTYFAQEQYGDALTYFQRALPIWFEVGSRASAARTLQAIGDTYLAQGQHVEAISLYDQALSLWQAIGSKQNQAETLLSLSKALSGTGDTAQAAAYDAQAQILLATPVIPATATPSN